MIYVSQSEAYSVTFRCPKPDEIQFVPTNSGQAWNKYIAYANVRVITQNYPPFLMSSTSTSNQVKGNYGASFVTEDGLNDYICNYAPIDGLDFILDSKTFPQSLQKCHFENGEKYECFGNEDQCGLVCEVDG